METIPVMRFFFFINYYSSSLETKLKQPKCKLFLQFVTTGVISCCFNIINWDFLRKLKPWLTVWRLSFSWLMNRHTQLLLE